MNEASPADLLSAHELKESETSSVGITPRLNEDVLTHIVSYLSTRDALNMSLTSHDIYPIAKRHALSLVTMQGNAITVRICTYMLDDIPGRLHWVRELEVVCYDVCNTVARLLVPLFKNAIHLKSLRIPYLVDMLLLTQPRIAPALSALRHLKILDLKANSVERERKEELFAIQREMLREMRSRPVELSLWIPSSSDLSCIQHIQTIKRLTLSRLIMDNEEYINNAEGPQPLLSTVSRLTLDCCRLSMSEAVRAFPNVRGLRVEYPMGSTSTRSVCWPHMDYVEGPMKLFEQWTFNCHVHYLMMTPMLEFESADDVTVLDTVRQTSPRILDLSAPATPELDTFWAKLADTAPQVRSLEISIWPLCSEMDLVFKTAQQLGIRFGVLNDLGHLIHIRLSYFLERTHLAHDGHLPITPTLDKLEQQVVHVLIEHIHSLRYVSIEMISIHGSMTRRGGSWRIVHSDKERTAERISQHDAKQIRAKIHARDFDPALFTEV